MFFNSIKLVLIIDKIMEKGLGSEENKHKIKPIHIFMYNIYIHSYRK